MPEVKADFSTTPLSPWRYVERLKVCLEIAAILIAGVWAYNRFIHDQAPLLEVRGDLSAQLGWEKVTEQQCQAEYEVQFQNVGISPLIIRDTQISVWELHNPEKTDTSPVVEYIDPMSVRKTPALYKSHNNRLVGVYAPGLKDTEGFSFVVKNQKGTRMLFEIEVWTDEDVKKTPRPEPTWHDFRWDTVCGDQEKASKPN